jgi:hypothetical protein
MRGAALLAALAAAAAPGAAMAQEVRPPAEARTVTVASPAGRTDSMLDGIDFDLQFDDKEQKASMAIGDTRARNWETDREAGQRSLTWLLRLDVPVSDPKDITPKATIDALSDGGKLTFNLSLLNLRSAAWNLVDPSSPFQRDLIPEAQRKCTALADPKLDCTQTSAQFARRYLNNARVNRSIFYPMTRIGAEGSLGFDRFEYLDPATLAKQNPSKLQFGAALYFIYYPSDRLSTVVLRAEYQNAFEARDEQRVCKPVVVDPAVDCVQNARIEPQHIERANLSLEYRRLFELPENVGSVAISPKATVDALTGDYEGEFPIYFLPKKAGPVSPGIKVSYSSRDGQVRYGAFLKSTFNF